MSNREVAWIMVGVLASLLTFALGVHAGRLTDDRSLTLCSNVGGVCGPHRLRGKFYYLVPERLWVDVLIYRARSVPHAGDEEEGG